MLDLGGKSSALRILLIAGRENALGELFAVPLLCASGVRGTLVGDRDLRGEEFPKGDLRLLGLLLLLAEFGDSNCESVPFDGGGVFSGTEDRLNALGLRILASMLATKHQLR